MATTKKQEMNVVESRDKLIADLQAVMQDAQSLISSSKDESVEMLKEKVDEAQARLKEQLAAIKNYEEKAIQQVCECTEKTQEMIRRHPWQTVGIAVVLGLIVGRIARR